MELSTYYDGQERLRCKVCGREFERPQDQAAALRLLNHAQLHAAIEDGRQRRFQDYLRAG